MPQPLWCMLRPGVLPLMAYNLWGAPTERGTFFRLKVYETEEILPLKDAKG